VQVPNANAVGFEKVYEQGDTPFCAGFGRWIVEFWPAMQCMEAGMQCSKEGRVSAPR